MAAGGRDGDGKASTGPLPVTLCAHDFLHTQGCTHSLAHSTVSTWNPPFTPWAHMQSEPSHVSAVPFTDTRAHVTTCSPIHRQPLLPCPPLPSPIPTPPAPPAQSRVMTGGRQLCPFGPRGAESQACECAGHLCVPMTMEAWGMDR